MAQPSLKPLHSLGAAIALLLAPMLAFAAAPAAGDQVGSGSVELKLSGAFKRQLKQNGVKLRPRKFTIKGGSFDSKAGSGTLTLNGKLTLKKGGRKVVLRQPRVSLGPGGALKSATGAKLFGLRGGRVTDDGFGARIDGVKAKLLRKGARTLNRKLGLHTLRPGTAGSLSVTEQPKSVPVTGGQTRVVPDLTDKGIAFKLADHCIQTIGGAVPIPPAQQDAGFAFIFPAVGGTIGPDGNAGFTTHSGGVQVNKNQGDPKPVCATVPAAAHVIQTDLQFDLKGNHVFADSVITGYPPPLGTPKGVSIAYEIDKKQMKVEANPNAGKITISGLELGLNPAAALFFNLVFPNSSGIPMRDFMPGDLFGTATMTLNTG